LDSKGKLIGEDYKKTLEVIVSVRSVYSTEGSRYYYWGACNVESSYHYYANKISMAFSIEADDSALDYMTSHRITAHAIMSKCMP
jgi:capsule polysaccharide export protein KpsE/RkpR